MRVYGFLFLQTDFPEGFFDVDLLDLFLLFEIDFVSIYYVIGSAKLAPERPAVPFSFILRSFLHVIFGERDGVMTKQGTDALRILPRKPLHLLLILHVDQACDGVAVHPNEGDFIRALPGISAGRQEV